MFSHCATMSDWKKSFIEAEQEKGEGLRGREPVRLRVGLYVTVCLYLTGTILILSTVLGIILLEGGRIVVGAGGCVGLAVVVAASVVTWMARGLANTALIQGYLVVGVLSVLSCVIQATLLALLTTLAHTPAFPPTPGQENLQAWVQFLGGAQGAMAVLVAGMVGGSIIVTACCSRPPQDNVVGVYHPR